MNSVRRTRLPITVKVMKYIAAIQSGTARSSTAPAWSGVAVVVVYRLTLGVLE
jgi:hypothetical protein